MHSLSISNREKQVLDLIAQEYTASEIAKRLYISKHTVDSHRKSLLDKFAVRNTAGMVRVAFEQGIFGLNS